MKTANQVYNNATLAPNIKVIPQGMFHSAKYAHSHIHVNRRKTTTTTTTTTAATTTTTTATTILVIKKNKEGLRGKK